MPMFIVRVELHNAFSQSDYTTLHAAMQKAGFSRTVKADNGITYQLPTAEYYVAGSYTNLQVLNAAKGAIATTGKTGMTLVAQASSWLSSDLPVVK